MKDVTQAVRVLAATVLLLLAPLAPSHAQARFDNEVWRGWVAASDGSPCETQFRLGAPRDVSHLFPSEALAQRVSGAALVLFDVVHDGHLSQIQNVRVFATSNPELFSQAAISVTQSYASGERMRSCKNMRAIIEFRIGLGPDNTPRGVVAPSEAWPPLSPEAIAAVASGAPKARCGVEGPSNIRELGLAMSRFYPVQAQQLEAEGVAVVTYSIGTDGAVIDPVALDAIPAGWGFEEAAVAVFRVARFPPRDSVCSNVTSKVHFRLR